MDYRTDVCQAGLVGEFKPIHTGIGLIFNAGDTEKIALNYILGNFLNL